MESDNREQQIDHSNREEQEAEKKQQDNTKSELLESAKVVADAAKTALAGETNKVDKAKVADAACDLLEAVQQYGKLDESQGLGKYVEQAENYLHHYAASGGHAKPADGGAANDGNTSGGGGGGFGDVMKMAGSFVGGSSETGGVKHQKDGESVAAAGDETSSGGGGSGGGGGFGDIMKMAQGFMSK